MILDQLTEQNKLTGYALWESLTLLVDYGTGGINNQLGNSGFDKTKPQGISLCWDHESTREQLGVDLYQYVLDCSIHPGTEISDHLVSLTVTTKPFNLELVHQDIYIMKVKRFRLLYPHLMSSEWAKYLSILEPDDFNEWFTN